MLKTSLLLLLASSGLCASMFTYNVAVNTASLTGTTGTLYFQFNPGDVSSDAATATISNFAGAALIGAPFFSGSASGPLPAPILIPNTSSNNDALQAVTFGSAFSFRVALAEMFTGTATTGSVFNFGVYQDDGVTPLLTAQPDGYLVIVNLDNANGATAQSTATQASVVSAVPEPSTLLLFAAGGLAFFGARRLSVRTCFPR